MRYKPDTPYHAKIFLCEVKTEVIKGAAKKTVSETGKVVYCSFRTFGGTEKSVNGLFSVEDTAVIETWYRPDINSGSVFRDISGKAYEVIGTPENIEMANKVLKFKVRAVKGGV